MKRIIAWCSILLNLGFLIPSTHAQLGNPPPCNEVKQVKIDSALIKRQILTEFISSCLRNNYWKNDKGIVLLREYQNEEGKQCWLLLPSIDDGYKANPPNRFATFNGDIILIFDATSKGMLKESTGNRRALNQCLEQIIGDRVYINPTATSRWTDMVLPFTNRKMKEGARRISGGNGGSLIITFNADGTYQKLIPV
jgi:hypothetical protein